MVRRILTALPLVLALQSYEARAQTIPLSQHATISQRVGLTDIVITYNRPVARGRTLFGGLVKWGRVWHPGADSATTIGFSKDVSIEGKPLPAGQYTIWAIPDTAAWTVIFSHALHVFHIPYPGESKDALRVTVTPVQGSYMEVLAYEFPIVGPDSAVVQLHWGTTIVPVRIRTR